MKHDVFYRLLFVCGFLSPALLYSQMPEVFYWEPDSYSRDLRIVEDDDIYRQSSTGTFYGELNEVRGYVSHEGCDSVFFEAVVYDASCIGRAMLGGEIIYATTCTTREIGPYDLTVKRVRQGWLVHGIFRFKEPKTWETMRQTDLEICLFAGLECETFSIFSRWKTIPTYTLGYDSPELKCNSFLTMPADSSRVYSFPFFYEKEAVCMACNLRSGLVRGPLSPKVKLERKGDKIVGATFYFYAYGAELHHIRWGGKRLVFREGILHGVTVDGVTYRDNEGFLYYYEQSFHWKEPLNTADNLNRLAPYYCEGIWKGDSEAIEVL